MNARDRIAVALATLGWVSACSGSSEGGRRDTSPPNDAWLSPASWSDRTQLRLVALAESYHVGEPLLIAVVLTNGGGPVVLGQGLGPLTVIVRTRGGDTVNATALNEPGNYGGEADIRLSHNGFAGRVFDLRCISWGPERPREPCDTAFKLESPGRYIVTFRYATIPPPSESQQLVLEDSVGITLLR